jgi:hypothetical protein
MRDAENHGEALLVARFGWWPGRVFLLGGVVTVAILVWWLLWNPEEWRALSWFLWLGMLVVVIAVPATVLEAIFRKTVFTERGIFHRSALARTRYIAYDRVVRLRVDIEWVVIETREGDDLRVYEKEAPPERVVDIVWQQTGGRVDVVE